MIDARMRANAEIKALADKATKLQLAADRGMVWSTMALALSTFSFGFALGGLCMMLLD